MLQALQLGVALPDKPFGCCSRCLYAHVCHIVEHGDVALMANTHYYRQRKLSHVGRQVVVVERCQIAGGSAAAYYHHAVEVVDSRCYAVKSFDNRCRGLGALEYGREQLGVEAQSAAVVVQLVYEVAVSGGSGGRYYCNPLHRYRPFELTVHVGNPFLGKALQNLASAPEQVAHGVVWVDVVYHQRQAVHGVVRGRHASHDFYVRCQRRACGHAELSVQRAETRSPDGGPQPGHGGTALRVFLYQLHVAMAARTAQVACFGCDPYVADGGLADCGAQAPGEFMQAYGIG